MSILKGRFTPNLKIHIFPSHPSRLFWCKLPRFGGISHQVVCLPSIITELDENFVFLYSKCRKNTSDKLDSNVSLLSLLKVIHMPCSERFLFNYSFYQNTPTVPQANITHQLSRTTLKVPYYTVSHQFHTAVRGPKTLNSICIVPNPYMFLNFSCLKVALQSSIQSSLFLCLHL